MLMIDVKVKKYEVLFAAVVCLCIALGGCAKYTIDDPSAVNGPNQALLYLPWWTSADKLPCELVDRKERDSLDLQPGMRLVIRSIPIAGKELNTMVLAPTNFEWIVPAAINGEIRYTREDFFFLNWLMIMARTVTEDSADREENFVRLGKLVWKEVEDERAFSSVLGEATIGRWTDPAYWRDRWGNSGPLMPQAVLKVQSGGSGNRGNSLFTPALIRTRLCGATREDFATDNGGELSTRTGLTARELVFRVNVLAKNGATSADIKTYEFHILNGDNWFFQGPLSTFGINNTLNEDWFWRQDNQIHGARADIDVEIAVRIQGEVTSRYFPPCLSVKDLETRFGRSILAVRRSRDYLSSLIIPGTTSEELLNEIVGGDEHDQYATFYFLKPSDYAGGLLHDDHGVLLKPAYKDRFMIGHRDVVILKPDRLSGSDNPGVF